MVRENKKSDNDDDYVKFSKMLREFRADKEKDKVNEKKLIDFLVRNNILPKYGFPVDTINLQPDIYSQDTDKVQMQRDLQYAIAEYAPGSEIIADGTIYTSRYIQKVSTKRASEWEYSHYATCPNIECKQVSYVQAIDAYDNIQCRSCGKEIPKNRYQKTIEPRKGFVADPETKPAKMRKPERYYRTDAFYIGDQNRRIIDSQNFIINQQLLKLESTSNDSLIVRTQTKFRVCLLCGYATGIKEKYNINHNTIYGKTCANHEPAKEYFLTHEFKTDVVRITFETPKASCYETMISVLFALLESTSKVLDIERNDLNGTLYKNRVDACGFVYSIIIYDAVGGGAGHSRRLVSEDGRIISKVISNAVNSLEQCSCDPSCYNCLRNYYNQTLHDQLNRKDAANFLREFMGKTISDKEDNRMNGSVTIEDKNPLKGDYEDWNDAQNLLIDYPNLVNNFIAHDIPLADFFEVLLKVDKDNFNAILCWESQNIILLDTMTSKTEELFSNTGWIAYDINSINPLDLKEAIKQESQS